MDLRTIENACTALYTAQDNGERRRAEAMVAIGGGPDVALPQLMSLLATATSPYAHLYASSSLMRLCSECWTSLAKDKKRELRNSAAQFMWAWPASPSFVLSSATQLWARLTKWVWADEIEEEEDQFLCSFRNSTDDSDETVGTRLSRDVMETAAKFFPGMFSSSPSSSLATPTYVTSSDPQSLERQQVGMVLLAELVKEFTFNDPSTGGPGRTRMSPLLHRQAALSFRDECLRPIFDLALSALRSMTTDTTTATARREMPLKLALGCLQFDYTGSSRGTEGWMTVLTFNGPVELSIPGMPTCSNDELEDDVGTVAVPYSWRPYFDDNSDLIPLFFGLYSRLVNPPASVWALECVIQIIAVRRSIWSDAALNNMMGNVMQGALSIFTSKVGLAHSENHHALARIFGQLRYMHLVSALASSSVWPTFFPAVVEFSTTSLKAWQWSPNSVHYILAFWAFLATNGVVRRVIPTTTTQTITHAASEVLKCFIATKLESAVAHVQGSFEDCLASLDDIAEQFSFVPTLARCNYAPIRDALIGYMDPLLNAIGQRAVQPGTPDWDLAVRQLSWLVHFAGYCIYGRDNPIYSIGNHEDEHDAIDADLVCRVMRASHFCAADPSTGVPLIPVNRDSESSSVCLRLATLSSLTLLHKVYFPLSQGSRSRVFFNRLGDVMGVPGTANEANLLGSLITEVKSTVGLWTEASTEVFGAAINLLSSFASSPISAKVIRESGAVVSLIADLAKLSAIPQTGGLAATQQQQQQQQSTPTKAAPPATRGAEAKWRSSFYEAVSKILFLDESSRDIYSWIDDAIQLPVHNVMTRDVIDERVDDVVMPMEGLLNALIAARPAGSTTQQLSRELYAAATGALSDLTGVAKAIDEPEFFRSYFGWLQTFHQVFTIGAVPSSVNNKPHWDLATAALKLLSELLRNNNGRLQRLGPSTPDFFLLFRLASQVVGCYAHHLLAVFPDARSLSSTAGSEAVLPIYRTARYLLWATAETLELVVFCGGSGFLRISETDSAALNGLIALSIRVATSLPAEDVASYPKLTKAFYYLIGSACSTEHVAAIYQTVTPDSFVSLLNAISTGVCLNDADIVSTACGAIAGLLQAYLTSKRLFRRGPDRVRAVDKERAGASLRFEQLAESAAQPGGSLYQLYALLVKATLFGDPQHISSIAKPLLMLSSILPNAMAQLKPHIVSLQPREDLQKSLTEVFEELIRVTASCQADPLLPSHLASFEQVLTLFQRSSKRLIVQQSS